MANVHVLVTRQYVGTSAASTDLTPAELAFVMTDGSAMSLELSLLATGDDSCVAHAAKYLYVQTAGDDSVPRQTAVWSATHTTEGGCDAQFTVGCTESGVQVKLSTGVTPAAGVTWYCEARVFGSPGS